MKSLLITSRTASNQDEVIEILETCSEVLIHYGELSKDLLRQMGVNAILSDRNGFILPQEIIDEVEGRVYNTHPSLLPLHRGWQPIFFSALEKSRVGVSLHQVDAGLDKGLLVDQVELDVDEGETLKTIHSRCRRSILDLLLKNWKSMLHGKCNLLQQKGTGCYHDSNEFDALFSLLPDGWNTKWKDVTTIPPQQDTFS